MIKTLDKRSLNRTFAFLLISLMSLIFFSCDPIQSINIENKTDAEAILKIGFSDLNQDYIFEENQNPDSLVIKLNAGESRDYGFNMGHWKINGVMEKVAKSITYVKIETKTGNEFYQGEAQIKEFFKSRILSNDKSRIQILLE